MAGRRLLAGVFAASAALVSSYLPYSYPFTRCEAPNYNGEDPALNAGEKTYICLNINGKVTSIYDLTVDSFAAISVQGSNYALPPSSGFIKEKYGWVPTIVANASERSVFYATFDIASHGAFSPFPRIYKKIVYNPSSSGVAVADISTIPVWTVIIQLEKGKVVGIGWDDGCFFCAENTAECELSGLDANLTYSELNDQTFRGCRKTNSQCYSAKALTGNTTSADANGTSTNTSSVGTSLTDNGCDLKVFVTWSGSDRSGRFMKSAGKRFSRYRAYGVATVYQSAVNLAVDAQNLANTAVAAVESVPGRIIPGNREERRLWDMLWGSPKKAEEPQQEVEQAEQPKPAAVPAPGPGAPAGPPGLPDIVEDHGAMDLALAAADEARAMDELTLEDRRAAWTDTFLSLSAEEAELARQQVSRAQAEAEAIAVAESSLRATHGRQ